MNSSAWIDARTACSLLGVKPQTLYAYVSRRLVRADADAGDARRSLYARADVEALLRRNHRPRARSEIAEQAIRWGDPVLETAIAEVREGMLWLRGRSVAECAEQLTLEEMAALLCAVERVDCPALVTVPGGATPIARALASLVAASAEAAPLQGREASEIATEGGRLMSAVTGALLGQGGSGALHLRFARAWSLGPGAAEDVRRALVLLADHELNPSTFAVRVCASTGASLPAALLSGMATLTGPLHGGVAGLARAAVEATVRGEEEAFLAARAGQSPYAYGYGHPLYPEGDPRARLVLGRLPPDHPAVLAQRRLAARLGAAANIDAALAVLGLVHGLPEEAAFTVFAAGRLAGWIAHAIEQARSGEIIRPRARYGAAPR